MAQDGATRGPGPRPFEGKRERIGVNKGYSKSGEDSEPKAWAGKKLPHLKEHLRMAEKLK